MYKLNLDNNYLKPNYESCPYCNKMCKNKNSFKQHVRLCKENPNRQESNLKNQGWSKGLTKDTDIRVYNHSKYEKTFFEKHSGFFKGKKHTQESKDKISKGRKKYLQENPQKVPYILNHSSKSSYPEQYFKELFDLEQIPLQYHLQISKYELDFYNLENKIDLEIDGEQHYLDSKIAKSDLERTKYLESLGWTVIRIRWSNYQKLTLEEKKKLINDIKELMHP